MHKHNITYKFSVKFLLKSCSHRAYTCEEVVFMLMEMHNCSVSPCAGNPIQVNWNTVAAANLKSVWAWVQSPERRHFKFCEMHAKYYLTFF